jgi:hypothetical protein
VLLFEGLFAERDRLEERKALLENSGDPFQFSEEGRRNRI